jgi:hypothetical protein
MTTQRKLHETAAEGQEMCTVENGERERKNTHAMTPDKIINAITIPFHREYASPPCFFLLFSLNEQTDC